VAGVDQREPPETTGAGVERPRDWNWSIAPWYDDFSTVPLSVDPIPPDRLD
jgi:hypothetical protein